MLHRRTYDLLSDTGTVIHWQAFPEGGLIVVQDEPSVFTVWREAWDESVVSVGTFDVLIDGAPHDVTFPVAQEIAKGLLASAVWV